MAKSTLTKFRTPIGVARYPHLNKPDTYKNQSTYHVDLILDGEEAQELIATIEEQRAAKLKATVAELKKKGGKHAAKAKEITEHPAFEPEYDQNGDETGKVILKAKMKASFEKDGETVDLKPAIFDAKNNDLTKKPPFIYGGSRIRVAGVLFPYYMASTNTVGVQLRMNGVKIIELVSGGSRDAASMGFEEEEGDDLSASASDFDDDDNDSDDSGKDEDDDF